MSTLKFNGQFRPRDVTAWAQALVKNGATEEDLMDIRGDPALLERVAALVINEVRRTRTARRAVEDGSD